MLQGDPEQLIAQGDHEKFCPHKTSHWLGLDVHDVGDYRLGDSWRDLMPGMVLTVEPGIYIPRDDSTVEIAQAYRGLGIRIEDAVLIKKQGCRVLTEGLIKDPDDIEAWMATRAGKTDDAGSGVSIDSWQACSVVVAGGGPVGAAAALSWPTGVMR